MKTILLFLSSLLLLSGAYAQSAGDYRSIASGDWNVVTNWEIFDGVTWQAAVSSPVSTDGVITIANPYSITSTTSVTADQVIVEAGASLNISAAFTIANGTGTDLTVNGTLNAGADVVGPGTTSVVGLLDWTTGTLSTPLTISAAGSIAISGAGVKTLGTTLVNNGTINWNAGNVSLSSGTITNNNSFINSFDGTLTPAGGTNSFANAGTFSKTGGSGGNTTIGILMTNSGTILVSAGTLIKATTSLTSTGTINVAAGAEFRSNINLNLNAGSSLTGSGTVTLAGASSFATAHNLPATLLLAQVPGSTLSGAGPVTVNGTFNWSGGSISSSCTIASGAIINASSASTKTVNGTGTLTNNGTINWLAGNISLANGTLTNNGTIDITFDGGTMVTGGGTNAFNNTGSFTKSAGTGASGVGVATNNSGSINVTTGTLTYSGVTQLNAGTILTGSGTLGLDGTLNVNTTVNAPASLTIRKSTGTTAGGSVFNVQGAMNWVGGNLGSTFHITTGAILTLSTATAKALNSTLNNDGTINWVSASVDFNNGTVVNNGTMNLSIDGALNNTSGTNLLNNTGTLNKIAGSGNSSIATPSLNSGTINVNSGTIVNSSSSFINSGTINIGATRTFSNTGTMMIQTGSNFTGSGTLSFSGFAQLTASVSLPATITFNVLNGSSSLGAGVVTVNGTMNWSGGTIGSPYLISATGTLNASGITKTLSNTLTNNGNIIWTAGNIDFSNGTITNNGSIDQGFDGSLQNISGTNLFTNNGTFIKSAGAITSSVNVPATNAGTITGIGGIQYTAAFTNTGVISPGSPVSLFTVTSNVSPLLSASSNLQIEVLNSTGAGTGNDQLVHNGNLVLDGTLTVTETGVVTGGDYTILQLSSGTISGNFTTVNIPVSYLIFVNASNIVVRKSILPLNWISFTGSRSSNGILLNWKTANEKMTRSFEVERSVDGSHFTNIGTVNAKGSNEVKAYSFEDLRYSSGVNYYRLKQIDIDGAFEYSKTIFVKAETPANETIRMFPNPAKGEVTVVIPEQWITADVIISNLSGQLMHQYKHVDQRSLQVQLPKGSYLVTLRKGDKSVTAQLRVN